MLERPGRPVKMEKPSTETMIQWAIEAGYSDTYTNERVESLTQEQSGKTADYVTKWVNKARSTEKIDFVEVAKWAKRAYQVAGQPVPEVVYATSPLHARDILDGMRENGKSLTVQGAFQGNQEASLLCNYDYYLRELRLEVVLPMVPLLQLAEKGGWVIMLDELIIVCERPMEHHWDDDYMLHNEDGMSTKWEDGFGFYTWHGKEIEGWIVENPERITSEMIEKERDADLQNILATQYGWHRLLTEIGAEVIDERENIVENTIEVLTKSKFGTKLIATCTTGRVMTMPVPDTITTCVDAQTWLGNETDYFEDVNVIGRT